MGIFEEDMRIRVSTLIRLWGSGGFLKPENEKSLETIGREFLKDLIDRNLILVDELGCTGNIKYCKMHDLLRDLCLKEGEKERFYHVIEKHTPKGIHNIRRLLYPRRSSTERVLHALKSMFYPPSGSNEVKSMSCVRSLTSQYHRVGRFPKFRLLRILNASDVYTPEVPRYNINVVIHELVNSRYLAFGATHMNVEVPSSVNFLWNLHTLKLVGKYVLPVEIWKISQLRYVNFNMGVHLPDPPNGNRASSSRVILENLATLVTLENFKCGEEVVNIIPNIKKLRIIYDTIPENETHDDDYYCLRNFEHLCKLEKLTIYMSIAGFVQRLTFPNTLKKLTLRPCDRDSMGWEEMLEKIGSSLPLLQMLVLDSGRFTTGKWEAVEGQFPSLKFLKFWAVGGLKEWIIEDSSHFPCLEKLYLGSIHQLEEIPAEIGYVPTLQSIEMGGCLISAYKSAKAIVEEQEELQGEQELSFHVRVFYAVDIYEEIRSLASPNFKIELFHFIM